MSGEANPFDPSGAPNPFADPSVASATSGGDGGYTPPAVSGGGGGDPFNAFGSGAESASASEDASAPLFASSEPAAKASAESGADAFKTIDQREADLASREAALRQREAALEARSLKLQGGEKINFPACYPVIHHAIDEDIAPHQRPVVKRLFGLCLATVLALWLNWMAMTLLWISVGEFLWSAIYAITGTYGAWNGWYMGVYRGFQRDSTTRFLCFFIMFLAHCGFAVFVCIGLEGTSVAGILTLINFTSASSTHPNGAVVIICIINTVLWLLITLVSFFLMYKMKQGYSDRGAAGLKQVQQDAAKAAAKQTAEQAFGGSSV